MKISRIIFVSFIALTFMTGCKSEKSCSLIFYQEQGDQYDVFNYIIGKTQYKEVKEWTLDIYGQGDRTDYRQLMVELGIDTNRCHLNGPVDDVGQVYMDSSIFVLSSRFEGFGLVLVEAMASGMSVVSFDCPAGPDEIITDGYDGLLVPPGDVKVLAQKLMLLMADKELRTRLSQNARRSAQRYEMNSIAGKWVDLFNKLMAKS